MLKFSVNIEVNGISVSTETLADSILSDVKILYAIPEKHLKAINDLVVDWLYENIHQGKDIYGSIVARKKKPSRVGGYTPFLGNQGLLYQGIISKKISASEYEDSIRSDRQTAAYYLITGTKSMPQREFWGVSEILLNKIENYLNSIKN